MITLRLKIKYPKLPIPNFITKENDITSAKNAYNLKHPNEKIEYIIVGINYIDVFVDIPNGTIVDGHQLSLFSKKLFKDFNWSNYSNKPDKLFKIKNIDCILIHN